MACTHAKYVRKLEDDLEATGNALAALRKVVGPVDDMFDEKFCKYVRELEESHRCKTELLSEAARAIDGFSDAVVLAETEFDIMRSGCPDCSDEEYMCGNCMTVWSYIDTISQAINAWSFPTLP